MEKFDVNKVSTVNKIPNANASLYGTSPILPKGNNKPTGGFLDALRTEIKSVGSFEDKNEYGKVFAYDNSPSGPTFRARYQAYGPETFNKIGFDPHIDNESVYNQNTNTFDDMKRWATHAAMPMVGLGFLSPINSYASALGSGDVGASTQEAKDYEYYNALGYSTKGGLGGFTTNLLNSVSYSAGILLEGVAEGMAIGAGVGAVAGEGIGAIPGSIIGGAVEGVKAFTKIPKALYQSVASLGKVNTAIKELKNINNAKNFFVNAAKGTGKFLNPLENTYDAYKSLKGVNDITTLAKTAKSAGAFWHDIMGINMALSEGRLEGGFAEQNLYNKLYNEHYAKYGEAPSPEEQQRMMMQSKEAGFRNTIYNAPLVFYSNKIAFPSITRAGFLKGVPRFNFGKVVGEVGKEFQLIFNPADDVTKAYYSKEAISLKNSLKALKDPKKLGAGAVNYFKKNLIEGLQEVSQEALAAANEKYYTDTYYHPAARGYMYGFGALMDGLGKQMNEQGAEVFGSGFLMGSLLEGPSKLFKFGTKNFSRLFTDKEVYQKYKEEKGAQADAIVNALNNMHQNAQHFFDPRMSNYATQMLVAKTVDNPDKASTKEIKDLEFAAFQTNVLTALRTGTFDIFIKNLGEYKTLTPEELEQAWSLEPGQGEKALQNIDKAIGSAKVTAARYDYAKNKFKDFVDLNNYKEGSPEYQTAQIYNQAYNQAITNFVFLQDSFDNGLNRLQKLYSSANKIKSLSTSPFANFSILSDPSKLNAQIQYLEQEIDSAASMNDPKLAEEIGRKRTLLNALNEFNTYQESIFAKKDQPIEELDVYDYIKSFQDLLEAIAVNNKEDGAYEDKSVAIAKLKAELDNNGGIEDLFTDLFDIHQLRKENTYMAKYINMLADPQGFYDHISKNFDWMKNLYNNRKEYYKEIVNKEISDVEKNEVLNALASRGIFVDLDEFAEWCNDTQKIPSYFIDTTKEMIINEDSVLYYDYARIFVDAANLTEKKAAGEPATAKQKYEDRLEELNKQKSAEISKVNEDFEQAFQDEAGITLEDAYVKNQDAYDNNLKLEKEQKEAEEKITKLQNLLESIGKEPLDADKIVQLADELLTPEESVLLDEEIDDEILRAIAARKFTKKPSSDVSIVYKAMDIIYVLTEKSPLLLAQKIDEQQTILKKEPTGTIEISETKAYKVKEERLEAINQRYVKFAEDLENEFKEKGIDIETQDEFTPQMGYDNYPEDLQALVNEKFNASLQALEVDPVSLQETNPNNYYNSRQNWLETEDGLALLNEYNKKVKEEGIARAKALKEPPVLTSRVFKNIKVDASIPVSTINIILDKLEGAVKNKIYAVGDKEIKLSEQDIKEISEDIEKLKTFLKYKQEASQPVSIQAKVFESFKKGVAARQDELVDVFDEDGNKIGRKFADDPDNKLTTRVTSISDKLSTDITGNTAKTFSDEYIDEASRVFFSEYNAAVKKGDTDAFDKAWKAFSELARTNFKSFNNEEKKARIRKSLELNTTEENFKRLLRVESSSNNAKAGTNLDATIRKFFTIDSATSTWAELKYSDTVDVEGTEMKISDIMSESAFENLFGVRGIVTRFRADLDAKGYIPLTNNVKLFDRSLLENGVSGETDMVLINTKGEIMIVDIKTSTSWNGYNEPNNWKNTAYRAQLSIYRNLYHNMTGVIPKIALFPIRVSLGKNGSSYVESITVGGEKTKSGPLVPLVPNTTELFNTLELEYLPEVETQGGITLTKPAEPAQTETTTDIERRRPIILKAISDGAEVDVTLSDGTIYNVNTTLRAYDKTTGTINAYQEGKQVEIPLDNIIKVVGQNDNKVYYDAELAALGEGTVKPSTQITPSDTTKVSLKDNLGKQVVYNGNVGTLIKSDDGVFGFQYKNNQGIETILDLSYNGQPAKDENIILNKIGLSLITEPKEVGQVSVINNQIIDAKFEDASEQTATINGVRYIVNRDKTQSIVSLTYRINDARIEAIDKESLFLENELSKLRAENKKIKDKTAKNSIIRKMSEIQSTIYSLTEERNKLVENNPQRTLRGGNTNDLIFALNRLPSSFTKGHTQKSSLDEKKELKDIASVSNSSSVATKMDEIINKNYPEAFDKLVTQGVNAINKAELNSIKSWAYETIDELYILAGRLKLEQTSTEEVDNQINGVFELLNDLELINLGKNGKILKTQPAELSKKFGPESSEQVQTGTSVSEVQEPVGGQAETIPGETGGTETQEISITELQKIVKSSTDELDDLISEEIVVNKATEVFAEITDLKALQLKKNELIKNRKSNKLNLDEINKAFENRKVELLKNVDIASLKVGDILQDITNFTGQDSPVQIAKINKNSVILKYGGVTQEVTEDELVNNFVKPTNEPAMEEVVKPSQETVDASEQTKTDAKIFFENKKTEASDYKEARESNEDDLFKNLEDNSKTC